MWECAGRKEGINIPCYMGRGSVVDQCRTHARLPFAPGPADSVKECSLCSDNNIPGQVVGIVSRKEWGIKNCHYVVLNGSGLCHDATLAGIGNGGRWWWGWLLCIFHTYHHFNFNLLLCLNYVE